jgi:phage gp29-like protein
MGRKRPPISFPELEGRGRKAILRTTEEVQAEEEILASQEAGKPGNQNASNVDDQRETGRSSLGKATYRLSQEALDEIDDAKRILRRQYQLKVSLEEIAEEAIRAVYQDLLENQHASILVSQLSEKKARRDTTRMT